jgi:hypothetical protein
LKKNARQFAAASVPASSPSSAADIDSEFNEDLLLDFDGGDFGRA